MTTHPHAIAAESFAIIRRGLTERGHAFEPPLAAVIERIVHSTADFEFADLVRTSPGAVEAGVEALRTGCAVLTDVHMVRVGVNAGRLAALGGSLHCLIDDPEVQSFAVANGITRGAQSMRLAAERGLLEGAIVAIGNAPTALEEVIRLVGTGARPALIIGVPVGFVGAAESKAALAGVSAVRRLIISGRQEGSTAAIAVRTAQPPPAGGAGTAPVWGRTGWGCA